MPKYSAFGATLGMGTRQIESTPVVGTIVNPGNATFTITAAGMSGSPKAISVAVLSADTADVVAAKAIAALNLDASVNAMFFADGSGNLVRLTRLIAAADDGTLNIAYTNGTCTGLTPDATSDAVLAGVASANIAYIKSIGGMSLSLDTEDVTTHDSVEAWEDVIVTILRSGEMSLEIVYDPNIASHSAAAGLIDYVENKRLAYFDVQFVSSYHWLFAAFVSGFEPSAPSDGALTASVTLKITGKPTLV